jgi:hypothetical protein
MGMSLWLRLPYRHNGTQEEAVDRPDEHGRATKIYLRTFHEIS